MFSTLHFSFSPNTYSLFFSSLEEAFPSLFEKKKQQDWWVMKQRVEDYAKTKKLRSSVI